MTAQDMIDQELAESLERLRVVREELHAARVDCANTERVEAAEADKAQQLRLAAWALQGETQKTALHAREQNDYEIALQDGGEPDEVEAPEEDEEGDGITLNDVARKVGVEVAQVAEGLGIEAYEANDPIYEYGWRADDVWSVFVVDVEEEE